MAWIRHLKQRRGGQILEQAFRMYRFHRTPFETLIENILRVMEREDARFTFPIVASIAGQKPDLLQRIRDHEMALAIHGYVHLRYPLLTEEAQKLDIDQAFSTFKRLGLETSGFRAPYNSYNSATMRILNQYDLSWDGGIGYQAEHRGKTDFFRIPIDGRQSSYVCAPLSIWSDDAMIDRYHLSALEISKTLRGVLELARAQKGLVMFDLHPIRIGQPQYVKALEEVVRHGVGLNGWFPTVTDAVSYRAKNTDWKDGADFCCLMTGDIDNFSFRDYLRRLS